MTGQSMADEELEDRLQDVPHGYGSKFEIDDAFSVDGDEHQMEFSSAAIREELARNFRSEEGLNDDDEDLSSGGRNSLSIEDSNASISTIDIEGPARSQYSSQHASGSATGLSQYSEALEVQSRFGDVPVSPEAHDDPQHLDPDVMTNLSASLSSQINVSADSPAVHQSDTTFQDNEVPKVVREDRREAVPVSTSLPLPSLTQTPFKHRPTRSVGPSALEKVLSKTRPAFLPPKSKEEDNRHLADWEAMMKHSRAAEVKRRKALQERRFARERAVELSIEIWEKEVLPDWKAAVRAPRLRKLWWAGIPPKLRPVMWEKVIGNALAISKDAYRICMTRAQRSISSGTFPTTTLNLIDTDIATTLPALHIFHPISGPLYQDLKDLLCAWIVSRSDEGLGYVPGVSKIAAMFLLNMSPSSAFMSMRNLLERHCMRSFYGGLAAKDDVEAYYRIFDTLLADAMPKIYFNFKQHQISPIAYLPDWLLPLFLDHLPLEACARIWDVLLLEGDSFLFRAALAILAVLEPRLYFPDREELLALIRCENKAALEVAQREGKILDGGKYDVYGVDEETLWERIEEMENWWKDSTWARLIQRELPEM